MKIYVLLFLTCIKGKAQKIQIPFYQPNIQDQRKVGRNVIKRGKAPKTAKQTTGLKEMLNVIILSSVRINHGRYLSQCTHSKTKKESFSWRLELTISAEDELKTNKRKSSYQRTFDQIHSEGQSRPAAVCYSLLAPVHCQLSPFYPVVLGQLEAAYFWMVTFSGICKIICLWKMTISIICFLGTLINTVIISILYSINESMSNICAYYLFKY